MLSHERIYHLRNGGSNEGHTVNSLKPLEIGDRGDSSFAVIDVVDIEGDSFVRKRPKFPVTPEARYGFEFFTKHLPEHPFLQQHFPETALIDDPEGPYYLQEFVQTKPGHANMTKLSELEDRISQQGHFDLEQIGSRETLADLLALMEEGMDFFHSSLNDPESGLEPDVGWFPEMNHPDSYVLGRLPGDVRDEIYFVDCHPIIPVNRRDASDGVFSFYTAIDEVARTKFDTRLVDLLRTNGNSTSLPISLKQLSSLCINR